MGIRKIDIGQWARKKHFHFFNSLDYPHFNLVANIDIAPLHDYAREKGFSVFKSILYLTTRVANEIPEYRFRIRGDEVIEHDMVHPSYTSMTDDGVFSFTDVQFHPDPFVFWENCRLAEEMVRQEASLEDHEHRDDYVFISCIPWVHFTSFVHPVTINGIDSVPRISWGKYVWKNNRLEMPLSVQAHHALLDGWHMGQFFSKMEAYTNDPNAAFT